MPEENGGVPEDVELEAAIRILLDRADKAETLAAAPRGENSLYVRAWHMANAAAIRKVLPYASAALTKMREPVPPEVCPFADPQQPPVHCSTCRRSLCRILGSEK